MKMLHFERALLIIINISLKKKLIQKLERDDDILQFSKQVENKT